MPPPPPGLGSMGWTKVRGASGASSSASASVPSSLTYAVGSLAMGSSLSSVATGVDPSDFPALPSAPAKKAKAKAAGR